MFIDQGFEFRLDIGLDHGFTDQGFGFRVDFVSDQDCIQIVRLSHFKIFFVTGKLRGV